MVTSSRGTPATRWKRDGEAVAFDLEIEPAEPPEKVPWVDRTHPG